MSDPAIPARDAGISICAVVLTLLLHIAPALLLLVAPLPPRRGLPPAEKRESVDRVYGAGLTIYTNPGNSSTATGLVCAKHSYIGIGVLLSYLDNHIIAVGDNTPAQRAGLRERDFIVNVDVLDGHFNEGTIHHLIVSRDGAQFPARVVVGRICNE